MTEERAKTGELQSADLKKVEVESAAKERRHRLDEYIAIVLGVGAVLLLWFLQAIGLY